MYAAVMPKLQDYDEIILQFADTLSPEAISFKLKGALTPEQVARRGKQLLVTPDWLTAAEQDQLVTQRMRGWIARMEDLPFTARTAEVAINSLEKLGVRLERRAEATSQDLSTLYAFQGKVMLESIDAALGQMGKKLIEAGAITASDWDDLMEDALRFAQMEIDKHDGVSGNQEEPDDPYVVTVTRQDELPSGFKAKTVKPPEVDPENRKKAS